MRRWVIAAQAAALGLLLSAARSASAQPAAVPPSFGNAGQLVLSSDAQGSLQVQSGSAAGSVTTITLGPAADLFVVRSFSIGIHALWQHTEISGAPDTNSFSGGASIGYALRMSDAFSFWPKVSFDYRHTSTLTVVPMTLDQEEEVTTDAMVIGIFAPVLFHPVPHFFIGLGPNFQAAVLTSTGSTDTEYGLMFTLGGWFSLVGG
jgi:hypothetical protein